MTKRDFGRSLLVKGFGVGRDRLITGWTDGAASGIWGVSKEGEEGLTAVGVIWVCWKELRIKEEIKNVDKKD
jgi:hypothetical protein